MFNARRIEGRLYATPNVKKEMLWCLMLGELKEDWMPPHLSRKKKNHFGGTRENKSKRGHYGEGVESTQGDVRK